MEEERNLGESDWDDLDLLTTDEAGYRLDAEISALRAQLAQNPDDPDSRKRLDLLVEARERMRKPRTFDLPKA